MKKTTLHILLATIAFGSFSAVTLAETGASMQVNASINATSSPKPVRPLEKLKDSRMDAKMEIKDVREKLASTTKEVRGEIKERVVGNIKRRAEHRLDKMTARLEATIERENAIMNRLNIRMEKIKAAGGNVDEAMRLSAEAKVHFDEATSALANLKVIVDTAVAQEIASSIKAIARETIASLKKATAEIGVHLREGHNDLVKAIASLRSLNAELRLNASTTVETKPSI